jgi:hypothetical protein
LTFTAVGRVELLNVDLVRGVEREHAGVVDEHVDVLDLGREALDVLEPREVGADEPRVRSVLRQRLDDLLTSLLIPSGDHDVGASRCVQAGDGFADPGCAAGDEHFLVFHGHVSP